MNLKKRLDYMVGKVWLYRDRDYKVNGAIMSEDMVIISTDIALLKFTAEEAESHLAEFVELRKKRETALTAPGQTQAQLYKGEELKNLFDHLISNIKKVEDSKDYVQQANTINKSITAITNLLKLEVQIRRFNVEEGI